MSLQVGVEGAEFQEILFGEETGFSPCGIQYRGGMTF
jgi:hypothetical protein